MASRWVIIGAGQDGECGRVFSSTTQQTARIHSLIRRRTRVGKSRPACGADSGMHGHARRHSCRLNRKVPRLQRGEAPEVASVVAINGRLTLTVCAERVRYQHIAATPEAAVERNSLRGVIRERSRGNWI
jgi:hypothetical protein